MALTSSIDTALQIVDTPRTCTVLLVDDMAIQLRAWARELKDVCVLQASNRAEARTLARDHEIDIAIVDLFLGHENGIDLVRELKQIDRDLFVVVVSAHASVAYAMAAVRAGADEVLAKPLSVAHLLKRVEQGKSVEPDWENVGSLTLDDIEWEHISRALVDSKENITQAAERLGIYRQTLQRKLRKRGRDA